VDRRRTGRRDLQRRDLQPHELRAELTKLGHVFRTDHSDTEPCCTPIASGGSISSRA
jgi:hypothetical protein